ncbi:hypothetical protein GOV09_06180 [Candidatus Woesearchaeota archaeon]|nr:hypothetical protein [Candidatus Woesearchaeota archaeon]
MKRLLFLVLLTACSSVPDPGDIILQTGTSGIDLKFLEGFSDEVVEGSSFYSSIEVRNEGFSDVTGGVLVPILEQDLMEIESWQLPDGFRLSGNSIFFDLEGKSLAYAKGERQVLGAVMKAREIGDARTKIDSRLAFQLCYAYKTVFSDTLCIDTDPANTRVAEKTCRAKDLTASSQGAPVAITRIEQRVIPTSEDTVLIDFTIRIKNKGKGLIVDPLSYGNICEARAVGDPDKSLLLTSLRFSNYEYSLGDPLSQPYEDEIECQKPRQVKDEYIIHCSITENNALPRSVLTFDTPIVVELLYGYQETISRRVAIVNSN